MKSSQPNQHEESHGEASALADRVRVLERALEQSAERARARRRFAKRLVAVTAVLAAVAVTVRVGLASAACAQTLPAPLVTMCVGEPAKAASVNGNFQQLVDWMQQKVGTVGSTSVAITLPTTIVTTQANTTPLFVTGPILDGSTGGGVEIRHSNLTQGIGFGYNTIYAAGTNPDQDLNLQAKGTGKIVLKGNVSLTGNVSGTGGSCYTRWGNHGCANGYDQVVQGHAGGFESFSDTGAYGASNVECVTDTATALTNWDGTYYSRMMRGAATAGAAAMVAVSSKCSVCCRSSCYMALGTTTCAAGYSSTYTGRVGGVEAFSSQRPNAKTLCVDDTSTAAYTWSSGYSSRLMRHKDTGASGGANGMQEVVNTCAVCCK